MDALLLGLIGAMVVGAAIFAVSLGRKGRRPGFSSGAGGRGSHDRFSSADAATPPVDPPVYLAHQAADAANATESSVEHGGHAAHSHSPLDSLVEAVGVSFPDSSPAPSSDSSSSFSSSFDSGSSFSSGDSGSSSSSGSD